MSARYVAAPITLLIGIPIGGILLLPSFMSFDAGDQTKLSMKFIGVSGLSVIPILVVSSVASIATNKHYPLAANFIPVLGITTAFVIASFE
jgi:hypothetical protein